MFDMHFKVVEQGRNAFILWPFKTPEAFLYAAVEVGARYKLRQPMKINQKTWIEFVPQGDEIMGEYRQGLLFGMTPCGPRVYRVFNARSSHFLTQHGLDGLPKTWWDAAYECQPDQPTGNMKFKFRVITLHHGAFDLTFYDWTHYFVSGRSGHISNMAITISRLPK